MKNKIISLKQTGMTLLEITVVLLILVALAGLAIPYVGGTSRQALCNATDVSMVNIKKAIMEGYYQDMVGRFPQDLDGLAINTPPKYNLHYLFSKSSLDATPRVHQAFSPVTLTGWREGGYLQGGITLSADLTGNFANVNYTDPLKAGHTVAMDSWGRPFVIQVLKDANTSCSVTWNVEPVYGYCARLVSAGSGNGLGLGQGDIDTKITQTRQADDRVLYLTSATPAGQANDVCRQ